MVGEVGLGAEAGGGVGVEEEEASGSLGVCRQSKKTFSIQKVNMYQKYTTRSPWCIEVLSVGASFDL